MKKQPLTSIIVYIGAAVVFFSFTAFLVTSYQSLSIGNNRNSQLEELDNVLNPPTAIDVSNQFFPLKVTNEVTAYLDLGSDIYQVNYRYMLNNNYTYPVKINNGVSYFLQSQAVADVVSVDIFSNKKVVFDTRFNGKTVNSIMGEPLILGQGETLELSVVAKLKFMPGKSPVRNIIEFTGEGAYFPDSFGSRPVSYPQSEVFSGSSVGLFYPGISLDDQKTDVKSVSFP